MDQARSLLCLPVMLLFLHTSAAVADSETGASEQTQSQAAELERLQQQIKELQQRTEAQRLIIEKISGRLDELDAEADAEGARRALKDAPDVSDEKMQRLAGKGTNGGTGNTQTDTDTQSATSETRATADEEVVKEARPSKSVENILREEHTLFDRRLTIEPGVTYSFSDRRQVTLSGFLALDAIFLGNIAVDTVKSHITTLDLRTRYGLSDRLELEFNAPFLYRSTTFQTGGVGGSATAVSEATVDKANIGDVTGSVYYRLFRETENTPDVVWNVGFRAPTGTDPFGIETVTDPNNNNLTYPGELPTGNGAWAITSGFSVLKTIDPAIVFANAGYTYNFENSYDDITGNPGMQPGKVKLGDAIRFGFGTAFALNERFSLSLSYAHRLTFKSETQQAGQSAQDIIGSDANVGTFNIGTTYALSDTTSLVSNVGLGLTNDASDVTISFRFPFQF